MSVHPSGHVYEYDGPFQDAANRLRAPFVRLKILDRRRDSSRGRRIREDSIRTFRADEILRLQPTSRTVPVGKENSPLGAWKESPLDRLIGIRSGGNTALFRNEVLLLGNRADAERLACEVTVGRPGIGAVTLSDILTWGSVAEGGSLESDDAFQQGEEPLIAMTHTIDRLAEACERAPFCSKMVILDGATAALRNVQAYDRMTACQRVLLIADHDEEEGLTDLAKRGCNVWRLSRNEILAGVDAPSGTESTADTFPPNTYGPLFGDVVRSATNSERLRVVAVPVKDEPLDSVADALHLAERSLPNPPDEVAQRLVGLSFSVLLEMSGWFRPPPAKELADFLQRIDGISLELNGRASFLPAEVTAALQTGLATMHRIAVDPLAGAARLEALLLTLNQTSSSGGSAGIVAKNAAGASSIAEILVSYLGPMPVFPAASLPREVSFDTLILASWLRKDVFVRAIHQYVSSDLRLLACDFEQNWLRSLLMKLEYRSRQWQMPISSRADLIGITVDAAAGFWPEERPGHSDGVMPEAGGSTRTDSEGWLYPRRKGLIADIASDNERRPARYVGFVGNTYAYLTPGRALPVVTDLVRGATPANAKVPMKTVDQLRPAEYVLFRDQGDKDVISLFAENAMGEKLYRERRAAATSWLHVLRSLGTSLSEIDRRLRVAGVDKHSATVRSWLLDPDKIGPGSRADLEAIAKASGDPQFTAGIPDIWAAIQEVRGAHIAAGQKLSDFLLAELPKKLKAGVDAETLLDLTLVQAWLVEIEQVGELEDRSYTEVNRLLWEPGTRRMLTPLRARQVVVDGGPSWPR